MLENITHGQLQVAAGLLEGEGCFYSYDKLNIGIGITCDMTDKEPIEFLFEIFGGRMVGPINKGEGRKPVWIWSVSRKTGAIEIAEALLPYMLSARRKAAIQSMIDLATARPMRKAKHGTASMRSNSGCKCDLCKDASNIYYHTLLERRRKLFPDYSPSCIESHHKRCKTKSCGCTCHTKRTHPSGA